MTKKILIIKPGKELRAILRTAIFPTNLKAREVVVIEETTRPFEAIKLLSSVNYDMVFIDETIDKVDANGLIAAIGSRMRRGKVWLMVTQSNQRLLPLRTPIQRVRVAKGAFDENFIGQSLRLLAENQVTPDVDLEVMRGILHGVIEVISKQTNLSLIPEKVDPGAVGEQTLPAQASALATFYSEGLAGSIVISAPRTVLYALAKRLFPEKAEALQESLYQDLCCEILNQILGIVRRELAINGYETTLGMNLALTGASHNVTSLLNGKYYRFPFKLKGEPFYVTLFHAYHPVSMDERDLTPKPVRSSLDVRLLNKLSKIVSITAKKIFQQPTQIGLWTKRSTSPGKFSRLIVANCAGRQGNYIVGFEISRKVCQALNSKINEDAAKTANDPIAALLASTLDFVCKFFNQEAIELGYFFKDVYRCEFASDEQFSSSIRGGGFFVRIPLFIAGFQIDALFGLSSFHAPQILDAWPCLPNAEAG
jgi:hypothetical protein